MLDPQYQSAGLFPVFLLWFNYFAWQSRSLHHFPHYISISREYFSRSSTSQLFAFRLEIPTKSKHEKWQNKSNAKQVCRDFWSIKAVPWSKELFEFRSELSVVISSSEPLFKRQNTRLQSAVSTTLNISWCSPSREGSLSVWLQWSCKDIRTKTVWHSDVSS